MPTRQSRLVGARVEGTDSVSVSLIRPVGLLKERGLVIEEATVLPDDECISNCA